MNSKVLLLVIIFILVSCKNKDELRLTDPTKKWVYYNSNRAFNKDSSRFLAYLKFDKNGNCVNYFFNGTQYGSHMKWEYTQNDSILNISSNLFLVLKIYNDSIIMKDLKYNHKVKMLNWSVLKK